MLHRTLKLYEESQLFQTKQKLLWDLAMFLMMEKNLYCRSLEYGAASELAPWYILKST